MTPTYNTIAKPSSPFLLKEKRSKFIGYALPIENKNTLKAFVATLKQTHPNANHFCYAWKLGINHIQYRLNDDGEPNNTAAAPIYGQIQSLRLTNIAVVVVRIFGGIKLGTGGLITAYRSAAYGALQTSKIITKTIQIKASLSFPYQEMHLVMRIIKKEKITIISQTLLNQCKMDIEIPLSHIETFKQKVAVLKACTLEVLTTPF